MYHRIATPESDIWDIAVSPSNFEQQLTFLKRHFNVIPLSELAEVVARKKIKRKTVSITFDDGYVDNYVTAKPLLEKYGLPATFFIASGNIGQETPFWWDELEQLILFAEMLPQVFSLPFYENGGKTDLKEESFLSPELRLKHTTWKACEVEPPTLRAHLYYSLWQQLKPLPYQEQQARMKLIREWAGHVVTHPELKSMSVDQLKNLGSNLLEIGTHTVTHPALAFHDVAFQKQEIFENRKCLQEITGQEANLIAYPYGNYNEDTLNSVASLNFKAAFTTEERPINKQAHQYRLGRYQVKNLPFHESSSIFNQW
ncbi:polysaccharide deacetylase family protein [Rufibacter tibetensis]|nr:polysaccharide deacetylase family protein [Rufibacter tibetensis]